VVEESEVWIQGLDSIQPYPLSFKFRYRTLPSFRYPAFFYHMASSSVLPTVHQLLEHVSQLLRRSSQTEAETGSVTLRCLELKNQIEQAKASVVEERMKQQVCRDEIARLKEMAAPRRSGSKGYICNSVHSSLGLKSRPTVYSMIATPGTLVPRPRSKYVSTARLLVVGALFDPSTDTRYGDDWRGRRRPVFPGFFAHQEERNVFRRGDFGWRREEGEHWFGVEP